ncbi:hypothetical protein [Acinetobacter sp. ANC 3832]|uniref:hypothetical protein n=1 Tax=Acinetobacter sp. ANC 3832 TaxID=1977874 RepID=UPI00148A1C51|nr:hypothetical protein [Acinetobacter sp. ANC 3832]
MTDQKYKLEMIRSIENLQLSETWIHVLDDAEHALDVIKAIDILKDFAEQWS